MTRTLRAGAALALAAAATLAAATAPPVTEADETVKAISAYDLAIPKAKMVARFYESLARWAKEHPAELSGLAPRLRGATIDAAAAAFEAEPGLRQMLTAHELTGRDVLLLPMALDATLAQVFAEARGMKMRHDMVNRKNVETVMKEKRTAEEVARRIRAARQALGPPPAP